MLLKWILLMVSVTLAQEEEFLDDGKNFAEFVTVSLYTITYTS